MCISRCFLFVVVALGLNMYSTKWANRVQVVLSVAKVFALVIVVIGGIVYMVQGG